ncbi:ubiquitin carboxyl-terminal hydrolase-related protein [Actinidia rufa]|uniref:Ubiquitin carboxyl-terminal hydrolase-related protein n=1 Tax=Actinidia rufa TaxID=165716 RepID=A0A7J0FYB2_9ERIC|nr:ubiquitin carboxyl-terminal hydrolase-related protein [Actinidia rufa]
MSQKMSSEVDDLGVSVHAVTPENVNGADVYGAGLKNEVGEYNCFLNVIIQSLWHLRRFRDEFLARSTSEHVHVGDPCVTCALYDIFTALSMASADMQREAVAPTSLRIALSNLYPDSNFFQEVMCAESSFEELLDFVEMNHQLACDPDAGGCGKLNYIHHILSSPPHVFTIVLGWQNTCESVEDITATLSSLATEIDISVLYRGLDPKNRYCLVSVVCYYGQHYHFFAYSHDYERWVMYDDRTVKVIGGWDDVLTMCEKGHLQPQVLFFEAVS